LEEKGLFTNQASLIVFLIPDSGKLAVSVYVGNPAEGAGRIDVIPENFHLLKVTDKGLSELKRAEAVKMAKSMERRERIGAAIGGAGASFSQTTATGTATYSDGSTANYSVSMPNTQAQTDAINRGQANIREAQSHGAHLIDKELKRVTLDPGQHSMGRLFFPEQKGGENLLVRADIGNVRYEIPFHLTGKHEAKAVPSATQREVSRPPQQAAATTVDASQQPTPTDPVQKAAWYRKAADQGDISAQASLGWLYARGEGVPQDYGQAVVWFRKAAEQGDARSQFNLGRAYSNGQGVPQDYLQAATWYRKAADQGLAPAEFSLGIRYSRGQGVAQDYSQAAEWFRKAAEQGDAGSENNLGDLYENGHGVPQDYEQAAAWYRKAADKGNAVAQFGLGSLYFGGHGVQQDYLEAYFWLKRRLSANESKPIEATQDWQNLDEIMVAIENI